MLRAWTQAARFFILDLRDGGVPTDPMVHFGPTAYFITEAVTTLDLSAAPVNDRSTSSARYSPNMMLALLTYSYSTGTFSSRTIKTVSPKPRKPEPSSKCAPQLRHGEGNSARAAKRKRPPEENSAASPTERCGNLALLALGAGGQTLRRRLRRAA